MQPAPTSFDEINRPPKGWRWWLFPIFWAIIFCIGLALSTIVISASHPDLLRGWGGATLAALLVALFVGYTLIAREWLYSAQPMPVWRGAIYLGAEVTLLLFLVWQYGPIFAWVALALLYPVIGRLPKRQLPPPVLALLLVFVAASWPFDEVGAARTAVILSLVVQAAVHLGIACGLRLLSSQSHQLRCALERLRLAHAELAASAAQQEELAVLRERTRLARDMHDNLGHALVVMNVKLEAAQLLYARDHARGDAELEATRTLIRETMGALRHTLADLRAPAASEELPSALERLAHEVAERSEIATTCSIDPTLPALPAEAREAIWYVAREALGNAEQHAKATRASISLECPADAWLLRVADNGIGIDTTALDRPQHYGVLGMCERMRGIGGTLQIKRGPEGGTIVEARLPRQSIAKAAEQ